MSSFRLFDIAGSAMAAQSVRLNTVASNLANADSVASSPEAAYRARMPEFRTVMDAQGMAGVEVTRIAESTRPAEARYQPGHPMADADGYVYAPAINPVEEMVNLMSSSRSYQSSVEAMNTAKELMMRTLNMGRN
ncbi:flagellar basal body rod protein FlgC [Flagellatimonas centrodinii]|uniref:flagellar basal body rod protein FlgC n=1 Tax=Flagellatimonas centrodinii TaxID=2806210 RepID=UPI001FEDCF17|nr:flagellar basal body rod protein FlgC [Flagellatimonas centrodinii]ULQ45692.1 flagellar basal body rod protein FlgC [Flagellatimonas centrodinii]